MRRKTVASTEHQIVEDRSAGIVQADDLAIQDRAFRLERLGNRAGQFLKIPKDMIAARNQPAETVFDKRQRPEPVKFDFVDVVPTIERLGAT